MRLTETIQKIKYYPDLAKDTFVFLLLILVAIGAFSIGRSSVVGVTRAGNLRIVDTTGQAAATARFDTADNSSTSESLSISRNEALSGGSGESNSSGMYVGSRSGKTYYLPWCAGVKRIKEENKIWFSSKDDALARGYKPSLGCKGI